MASKGGGDLAGLNALLQTQPYVGGFTPSEADRKQIEALFGDHMSVLRWAGRMAAYYPVERAAIASGKRGHVDAAAPKIGDRDIGGVEGCVDGTSLDKLENPSRIGKWTTRGVRKTFVDFNVKKGCTFVPSSPVVPLNDPTLLFTNAGMNQFKPNFLGTVEPGTEAASWKGATNSQKCIRAGGKHNDLDDVGKDTYHHTYFEMLGNWSFGDYFKKETIAWAWELLTEVYKIPKDRLYVTYFHDDESGLEPDFETKEIWKKYVDEKRILKGSMGDNFWEMGDTGPCGPCTEIHYDRIGGRDATDRVNAEPGDPMVIEIWNLVFIQFNREKPGPDGLRKLPARHVDTGMGLERIASVLQGVYSNYNTDAFWGIFKAIQEATGFKHAYHSYEISSDEVIAYRVIADHARTISVAITDGGVPDSDGRGFVLRRVIRRAVRFGKEFLNAPLGFFAALVPAVAQELGDFFPEMLAPGNVQRVQDIILLEEKAFDKTWKAGLKHFQDAFKKVQASGGVIKGDDAWILHDRHGFPVDLTQLMAEKSGCPPPFVDMEGFLKAKEEQQGTGGDKKSHKTYLSTFHIDELQKQGVPATLDESKYKWEKKTAKVVGILDKLNETLVQELSAPPQDKLKAAAAAAKKDKKGKKAPTPGAEEDESGGGIEKEYMCVLVDATNFYYESGGQIWDTGAIVGKDFRVQVTRVPAAMGGYICHVGLIEKGTVKVGAEVELQPDYERRLDIGSNHTATHELNRALREVLERKGGGVLQVNQKGSLVEPAALRFDFSWSEKLSVKQIEDTEETLNRSITDGRKVYSADLPLAEAKNFYGLRQMFGEKYPDPVRVVSIGAPLDEVRKDPQNPKWVDYSLEFCGGTHLETLKDCQRAVIVSEDALMQGIRRMSVITRGAAAAAVDLLKSLEQEHDVVMALPADISNIDDKIKKLSVHNKKVGESQIPLTGKVRLRDRMEEEIKQLHADKKVLLAKLKAEAQAKGAELGKEASGAGRNYVATQFDGGVEVLQAVCDGIAQAHPACGVFLVSADGAKAIAFCVMSAPQVKAGKSAVEWVKAAVGRGGGKADKAQMGFGGKECASVLSKAQQWAAQQL
eukprot:TRINITY_DN6111_c0_g1_i1.p1 TRINITY_DN6111_c0_g1~~TRINITY_DN6111_c0_g1_i1.p1  ORF type:complete len:1093 (+),score=449.20 TRINITY_DN6111_c0_g1_i1:97-3375(+)